MPKSDTKYALVKLQPLRVFPGWLIEWNKLREIDPSPEAIAQGFFGGSSLFYASSIHRRSLIDVEWLPEDNPDGRYRLCVYYAPWKRTPKGRRFKDGSLEFDWDHPVHMLETRSRAELVAEIERWMEQGPGPRFEGS